MKKLSENKIQNYFNMDEKNHLLFIDEYYTDKILEDLKKDMN